MPSRIGGTRQRINGRMHWNNPVRIGSTVAHLEICVPLLKMWLKQTLTLINMFWHGMASPMLWHGMASPISTSKIRMRRRTLHWTACSDPIRLRMKIASQTLIFVFNVKFFTANPYKDHVNVIGARGLCLVRYVVRGCLGLKKLCERTLNSYYFLRLAVHQNFIIEII